MPQQALGSSCASGADGISTKKMRKAIAGHCDTVIHDRLVRVVEIPSGVTSTDLGTFAAKEENLQIDGQSLKVADLLFMLSQGGMLGIRRGHRAAACNPYPAERHQGGPRAPRLSVCRFPWGWQNHRGPHPGARAEPSRRAHPKPPSFRGSRAGSARRGGRDRDRRREPHGRR